MASLDREGSGYLWGVWFECLVNRDQASGATQTKPSRKGGRVHLVQPAFTVKVIQVHFAAIHVKDFAKNDTRGYVYIVPSIWSKD